MPELGFTDLLLGFLLLITPVVYFHELGHYWVARKAGVVVDVFSIGFGPEIMVGPPNQEHAGVCRQFRSAAMLKCVAMMMRRVHHQIIIKM